MEELIVCLRKVIDFAHYFPMVNPLYEKFSELKAIISLEELKWVPGYDPGIIIEKLEEVHQWVNQYKDRHLANEENTFFEDEIQRCLMDVNVAFTASLFGEQSELYHRMNKWEQAKTEKDVLKFICYAKKRWIKGGYCGGTAEALWGVIELELDKMGVKRSRILKREAISKLSTSGYSVYENIDRVLERIWRNWACFTAYSSRATILAKLDGLLENYETFREEHSLKLNMTITSSYNKNCSLFGIDKEFDIDSGGLHQSSRQCRDSLVLFGKSTDLYTKYDVELPNSTEVSDLQIVMFCHDGFKIIDFSVKGNTLLKLQSPRVLRNSSFFIINRTKFEVDSIDSHFKVTVYNRDIVEEIFLIFPNKEFIIGSDKECDYPMEPHISVSTHHASLRVKDKNLELCKIDPYFITYVGLKTSQEIKEKRPSLPHLLEDRDLLRISEKIKIFMRISKVKP